MNVDAFRHFYNYHFAENRKIWDSYIAMLPEDLFTRPLNYSVGSVQQQILHLISVDDVWFSGLRGEDMRDWLKPSDFDRRDDIRIYWDSIEQKMRDYLDNLSEATLLTKPLKDEDENLIVWQVLLHVVNHGTDHRAQILRALNDMGVKTQYQDYIFYVYDHP